MKHDEIEPYVKQNFPSNASLYLLVADAFSYFKVGEGKKQVLDEKRKSEIATSSLKYVKNFLDKDKIVDALLNARISKYMFDSLEDKNKHDATDLKDRIWHHYKNYEAAMRPDSSISGKPNANTSLEFYEEYSFNDQYINEIKSLLLLLVSENTDEYVDLLDELCVDEDKKQVYSFILDHIDDKVDGTKAMFLAYFLTNSQHNIDYNGLYTSISKLDLIYKRIENTIDNSGIKKFKKFYEEAEYFELHRNKKEEYHKEVSLFESEIKTIKEKKQQNIDDKNRKKALEKDKQTLKKKIEKYEQAEKYLNRESENIRKNFLLFLNELLIDQWFSKRFEEKVLKTFISTHSTIAYDIKTVKDILANFSGITGVREYFEPLSKKGDRSKIPSKADSENNYLKLRKAKANLIRNLPVQYNDKDIELLHSVLKALLWADNHWWGRENWKKHNKIGDCDKVCERMLDIISKEKQPEIINIDGKEIATKSSFILFLEILKYIMERMFWATQGKHNIFKFSFSKDTQKVGHRLRADKNGYLRIHKYALQKDIDANFATYFESIVNEIEKGDVGVIDKSVALVMNKLKISLDNHVISTSRHI